MQLVPIKKIRKFCNFHHSYTSAVRHNVKKIQEITLYDYEIIYLYTGIENEYLSPTNKLKFWPSQIG